MDKPPSPGPTSEPKVLWRLEVEGRLGQASLYLENNEDHPVIVLLNNVYRNGIPGKTV